MLSGLSDGVIVVTPKEAPKREELSPLEVPCTCIGPHCVKEQWLPSVIAEDDPVLGYEDRLPVVNEEDLGRALIDEHDESYACLFGDLGKFRKVAKNSRVTKGAALQCRKELLKAQTFMVRHPELFPDYLSHIKHQRQAATVN